MGKRIISKQQKLDMRGFHEAAILVQPNIGDRFEVIFCSEIRAEQALKDFERTGRLAISRNNAMEVLQPYIVMKAATDKGVRSVKNLVEEPDDAEPTEEESTRRLMQSVWDNG